MNKLFNYLESHNYAHELFLFGTLVLGSFLIGTIMTLINSL